MYEFYSASGVKEFRYQAYGGEYDGNCINGDLPSADQVTLRRGQFLKGNDFSGG